MNILNKICSCSQYGLLLSDLKKLFWRNYQMLCYYQTAPNQILNLLKDHLLKRKKLC